MKLAGNSRDHFPSPTYPPVAHRGSATHNGLSFQQQTLWLMVQLKGAAPAYNNPFAYRLKGPLQVNALERSWNELIRRHESLRTIFPLVEGEPTQVVSPELLVRLPLVDLRGIAAAERERETHRLMQEWARRPFDVANGPLLRAALFQQGDADYVFVFDVYHIVFDGWSLALLVSELSAMYNAFAAGQPSPFPELQIQYTDFVAWQKQLLQDEGFQEKQVAFWSEELRGVQPLNFPTDSPRPAHQGYDGATSYWKLSKNVSDSLRALCEREGVSVFRLMTAAWQTLLHRHTGAADIVVGCPFANRNRPEFEKLIGFFINTLPLRTDFSGDPTFLELLHRVRDQMRRVFANRDLPFGKIVEALRPDRAQSHHPYYQAMIVQRKLAWQMPALNGIESTVLELDNATAKFDLSLYPFDDCDELFGYVEYNTDLFDDATIARMVGHFENLLTGIAADATQPVSRLPLLSQAERQQTLVEWNATATGYARDQCVHQMFEAQAASTPEAVAVKFEQQELTYHELNARANQVAHYLRKLGVRDESLVGMFVDRSLEMVAGLLGILKAGAAYVPMDPTYPSHRLGFMVEDANPPVILTQKRLLAKLPPNNAKVICLDEDWPLAKESGENPSPLSNPENLAYTIFTSGSTGRPKGVEVLHRGVANFLESMRQQLDFNSREVLLAVTSLSFDISYLELFLPLITGGKLVVVGHDVAVDGHRLLAALADSHATFMQATPATWHLLIESGWEDQNSLTVLCGGEALTRDLANKLVERSKVVWNLYGPTETTIWSTAHRVESGTRPVSIGRPIANTQIYILDAHFEPVPVGVPGELMIGGDGVARGYLGRPDLTEQKFIPDPFSARTGDRLYRTGDLGRWRTDGTIECLGRLDHQVKIRGFRIELEEIEAVLRQCPAVLETVAVVREDTPGEKRLAAYVVPVPGTSPAPSELSAFLKDKLPDYMVPSAFVLLERMPLTPNGKVDRRALPVPDYQNAPGRGQFVAPRDAVELKLAKIWESTLGVESIGVTDNFFDLGGHSVLGGSMLARVEKQFGKTLPFSALFQASTIEQLAAILREQGWNSPPVVPLQPGGTKPPFFAVYARVGYRELSNELGPDQPFYVLPYDNLFDKEATRSLKEIAAELAGRMRAMQPEGPYYLGGMCLAGIVAFAIAVELYDQGQEVALLAVMDAPAPGYRQKGSLWVRLQYLFTAHVTFHIRNLIKLPFKEKPAYLLNMLKTDALWHFKMRAWRLAYNAYRKIGFSLPRALRDPFRLMGQAALGYKPPHIYQGRVTLFRPSTRPTGRSLDPALGWGSLVSGALEVHDVPGGHRDLMVSPQVTHLGRQLKQRLQETRTEIPPAAVLLRAR